MSESTQFRIGGIYRKQNGDVVTLTGKVFGPHKEKWEEEYPGHTFAQAERLGSSGVVSVGYISLLNGRYVRAMDRAEHGDNLLPGELTLVNGEWVPADSDQIVQGFGVVSEPAPECGCQVCRGKHGGGENHISGMVLCDFCMVRMLKAKPEPERPPRLTGTSRPAATASPTS